MRPMQKSSRLFSSPFFSISGSCSFENKGNFFLPYHWMLHYPRATRLNYPTLRGFYFNQTVQIFSKIFFSRFFRCCDIGAKVRSSFANWTLQCPVWSSMLRRTVRPPARLSPHLTHASLRTTQPSFNPPISRSHDFTISRDLGHRCSTVSGETFTFGVVFDTWW